MAERIPDETLNYWADAFIRAELSDRMTFEEFMAMPPRARESHMACDMIDERIEARMTRDCACELHGKGLIERLHHAPPYPGRRDNRPVGHYLRRAMK